MTHDRGRERRVVLAGELGEGHVSLLPPMCAAADGIPRRVARVAIVPDGDVVAAEEAFRAAAGERRRRGERCGTEGEEYGESNESPSVHVYPLT